MVAKWKKVTARPLTLSFNSALYHPHSLELLLSLAPQIPHQPLRGEGILWWHAPAHHSIEESLPLTRVESQHLRMGHEGVSQDSPGVSFFLSFLPSVTLPQPPHPSLHSFFSYLPGAWPSPHLNVAPNSSQQWRQWLILFIPELPLRLSTP